MWSASFQIEIIKIIKAKNPKGSNKLTKNINLIVSLNTIINKRYKCFHIFSLFFCKPFKITCLNRQYKVCKSLKRVHTEMSIMVFKINKFLVCSQYWFSRLHHPVVNVRLIPYRVLCYWMSGQRPEGWNGGTQQSSENSYYI